MILDLRFTGSNEEALTKTPDNLRRALDRLDAANTFITSLYRLGVSQESIDEIEDKIFTPLREYFERLEALEGGEFDRGDFDSYLELSKE